jgi:quinol monooxygenase YgiN
MNTKTNDNYALLVRHRTKPGMRARVQAVWQKHMQLAISQNTAHLGYFYCFSNEPDEICAFQCYSHAEAAADFVQTAAYEAYQAEVAPLLEKEPSIEKLSVVWSKST